MSFILIAPSCDFIKSHNPFGKKAREAEALRQQQEAFRIADSIKVAEEQAAREREILAEQARLAEQETMDRSKYYIIVGSFLTPEYATSWEEHITSLGHNADIVEMGAGRWKLVSVSSYATLNEAWNALKNYQDNVNMDAWVYKPE